MKAKVNGLAQSWWQTEAAGWRSVRFSDRRYIYAVNGVFALCAILFFILFFLVNKQPSSYWEHTTGPASLATVLNWFSDRRILDVDCSVAYGGFIPTRFIDNYSFTEPSAMAPLNNVTNALYVRVDVWSVLQMLRTASSLWDLEIRSEMDKFRATPQLLRPAEYVQLLDSSVKDAFKRASGRVTLVELFASVAQDMAMTLVARSTFELTTLDINNILQNPNSYSSVPVFTPVSSLRLDRDFKVVNYSIAPYDSYFAFAQPRDCKLLRAVNADAVQFFRFIVSIGAYLSWLLLVFRMIIQFMLFLEQETSVLEGKLPVTHLAPLEDVQPEPASYIDAFQHETRDVQEVGVHFVAHVCAFLIVLIVVIAVGATLGKATSTGIPIAGPIRPSDMAKMAEPLCQCKASGSTITLGDMGNPVIDIPEWCIG